MLLLAAGSLTAGLAQPAAASAVRQPLTGLEQVSYTTASNSDPEHEDGYGDDWWIRAYAICANPPTGWALTGSSNQTSYPTTNEYTSCSAGKTAISAGADLNGAYGEVALKSLRTFAYQGQHAVATASEDETGAPDTWDLTTDAICVQQ